MRIIRHRALMRLLLATSLLGAGVFAYAFIRAHPPTWVGDSLHGFQPVSDWLRYLMQSSAPALPAWMIDSLPGALWLASGCILIGAIFPYGSRSYSIWVSIFLVLALLYEILQLPGIIRGTFDPLDLLLMIVAFLIVLAGEAFQKTKYHPNHEKSNPASRSLRGDRDLHVPRLGK